MGNATTIRVSKGTLQMLESLKDRLRARSIDQAIQMLIMRQRITIIDEAFGRDRNRVRPFTEDDRGEDRS